MFLHLVNIVFFKRQYINTVSFISMYRTHLLVYLKIPLFWFVAELIDICLS